MYWLIFFNGYEVPSVEASFLIPYYLCKYVKETLYGDGTKYYHVLEPNTLKAVPLSKFLDYHKED